MPAATATATMFVISSPQVTGVSADGMVQGPQPIPARWLADVERRIRDSIVPTEHLADNDGRWLSMSVANSAIQFFRQPSAVLPGEPFIYSSASGDLVAEKKFCKGLHGLMTSVVTEDKVLAMAMVNGHPAQVTLDLLTATEGDLRRELKPIADFLCKGQHAGSARP